MTYVHPEYLVQTDWLAAHIDDPELRILDCTVFLRPPADSPARDRASWTSESGRAAWTEGHIPNSDFVDLVHELSDPASPLPFMMPQEARFAEAMSRHGVGEGTRVVLYDAAMNMWAARVWWMLRAHGFDDAAVLDGGWKKWTSEGRPVSTEPAAPPRGHFVARPRPELIAGKDDVLAAIEQGTGACVINALSPEQHRGEGEPAYGRAGRIASSVNVPARGMVDRDTHAYRPAAEIKEAFASAGANPADRVITYCGGGIAASGDALLLTMLGYDNVAVYDGSLSEWARDESLPMEVG